jgi:hypothetical protein
METGEIKSVTSTTPPPPVDAKPAEAKPAVTEAKPAADGKAEKVSLLNDKKEAPKVEGAPETYAEFKAPEGFEINKEQIADALPVFKELGLSQEGAQKLVDFYAKVTQKAQEDPYKLWSQTQEKWVSEVKADPVIGGKLDQVKATVARAIDGLGDAKLASDFRAAMDYTGAGNNPAFIRAFYKLATQITEGRPVGGNGPSTLGQQAPGQGPKSIANALFPNLP